MARNENRPQGAPVKPQDRPDSEWETFSGADGWRHFCTLGRGGLSVLSRKGDDGRTDAYGAYTPEELADPAVQEQVIEWLGRGTGGQILDEASARFGFRLAVARQPAADIDAQLAAQMREARRRVMLRRVSKAVRWSARPGERRSDHAARLFSLLCGVVLTIWLLASAGGAIVESASLWWHARVADDLARISARVAGHDTHVFSSDGSWAHKGMPSSSRLRTHEVYPVLEIALPEGERLRHVVAGRYGSREKALAALAAKWPLGAEVEVFRHPSQTGAILLSPDEAPTTGSVLLRVLIEVALLLIVYLPLVVLLALLVPPALVWVVTRPFQRR